MQRQLGVAPWEHLNRRKSRYAIVRKAGGWQQDEKGGRHSQFPARRMPGEVVTRKEW
ncbi:hypothetical protein [Nitrosospira sp. Nsp14]|uniref:hypothetical protein n=1 Tax=Nitrosospira sp. Nsp14 TaxID=1855333 RepID=UPI0015A5A5B1|nr:hypothetical protein [Nitrosospira sp. Nsp14]